MKCRYISLGGWLVHPSYMWNNVTIFVKNNLWLSVIYFLILLFYYSTLTFTGTNKIRTVTNSRVWKRTILSSYTKIEHLWLLLVLRSKYLSISFSSLFSDFNCNKNEKRFADFFLVSIKKNRGQSQNFNI